MSRHRHIPLHKSDIYEVCKCGAVRYSPSKKKRDKWHGCAFCTKSRSK